MKIKLIFSGVSLKLRFLGIYFSPRGGCAQAIISLIEPANKSIHVLIYSFTLDSIGDALIAAYERGVDVKVVFEKDQIARYSKYWRLRGQVCQYAMIQIPTRCIIKL
ncbi:MAG: phospholipase D-like domain-containing protein [Thermoproteota archaeon]